MPEKKRCIRCNREIDAVARICPFCNWDQSDLAVSTAAQTPENTYVPPVERPWRRYGLLTIAGIVTLVAAFALGSILQGRKPVHGLEQQGQEKETPQATTTASSAPRTNVTLVPTNASDTVPVDQPITSAPVAAPAQGVPAEYQRSDATAVSSVEYAQLAARAQAEKKKQKEAVDPRTLTGPAYAQSERPQSSQPQMSSTNEPPAAATAAPPERTPEPEPAPRTETHSAATTRPVPEYQPIPDISVSETTTVRLQLTVGADGRVKEVNVLQGVPGQTSKIISTVQTWRFRPATENGTPVSAPFNVDLSFRGQ